MANTQASTIIKLTVVSVAVIVAAIVGLIAFCWTYSVHQLTSVPRSEVVRFVSEDALSRLKESGFGRNAKIIEVFPQHEVLGHLEVSLLAGGNNVDVNAEPKGKAVMCNYELGCEFGVGGAENSKTKLVLINYKEQPVEFAKPSSKP